MDRSTDLHILSQSEMFRGLPAETLDRVRAACVRRQVARGETVLRQDEPAASVHVVVAGRLRVTQTTAEGQQIIISYLGAGETAGYNAIVGDKENLSTVVAVENSALMTWSRSGFRDLMARHAGIAMNALAVMESRYEEMQTRLRELSTETVERRLAHTLLRLMRQAGRRTAVGVEIAFPLSRQDLAEMAGTTLHTVSRTVSAWEGKGVIESGRRRVVVRDPEALGLIAGDIVEAAPRAP